MKDLITYEVIRDYLQTVAAEILTTLTRSAVSVMFNEAHDCSAGVFYYGDNDEVTLISNANSVPVHLYASLTSVEECLKYFKGDLNEGDVILVSDPYHGGSHICDYTIVKPVFIDGKPVFFPALRGHFLDVGSPFPGSINPIATEIHQEGFRFPPLKLYEKGEFRRDVWELMIANTRLPDIYKGDLGAMIGACKVGEDRVIALANKYGMTTLLSAIDYMLDYSENKFRKVISQWPNGRYTGRSILDSDFRGNTDINVDVAVTVYDDYIEVDFEGTHKQSESMINSVAGNTLSYVYMAFTALCAGDIPVNSGFFRPIKTVLPAGTVVNPDFPACAAYATICIGADIGEAMAEALSKFSPNKIGTISIDLCLCGAYGVDARYNKFFVAYDYNASPISTGGTYGVDGWGGWTSVHSASQIESVEQMEIKFPLLYLQGEYAQDTAAPGKWRGAPAYHMQRMVYGAQGKVAHDIWIQKSEDYALKGYVGGEPGAGNYAIFNYNSGNEVKVGGHDGHFLGELAEGESVFYQSGGGGGWGAPIERAPDLVLQDVLDEYISIEEARKYYGIVIDPEKLQIDDKESSKLRQSTS